MTPRIVEASLAEHRATILGRLLDACAGIAATDGLHAISLGSAARAAGISRSSIYSYVANRDDLIRRWGEREMSRFLAQVDRAPDEPTDTASEQLRRLLSDILIEFSTRPQISVASEAPISPELKSLMMEHLKPLEVRIDKIIARGIRRGEFQSDADTALPYVLACLEVERRAIDSGEAVSKAAKRLVRFVLASFAAEGGSHRRPTDAARAVPPETAGNASG
ncbi:TetR/AcrR family transcriptional regulator [Agromyces sp. GXS1127]|uniref:TetR/AcrR family transcriptional regulator n=1 Tax=Agromyces sp. GXS1127 TaxID=3424181 RepID=UPI003D320FF7